MTPVARKQKLGYLHALKRQQGLPDDLYRDKLEQITGSRSAGELSEVLLDKAIAGFHVKQKANTSYTAKAKALWIAAFNLGALGDGTDHALDAFVQRQTGKPRLAFLTAADANSVSEALKAICERHGFTVPPGDAGGLESRRALLRAQWQRLAELGAVQNDNGLAAYASRKYLACHGSENNLTVAMLDDCAKAFGRWIRQVQKDARGP